MPTSTRKNQIIAKLNDVGAGLVSARVKYYILIKGEKHGIFRFYAKRKL